MKLRQKAHFIKPTVWIGKQGISEQQVSEIKKQLKNTELVKVKFLKAALKKMDRKKLASELVEKTGAKLVKQAGFMAVLYKQKKAVIINK